MEIIDYSQNKGIIPIKLGNAKIIIGHDRLLHIINLESYEHNLNIINNSIKSIQTLTQDKPELKMIYKTRVDVLQMKNKLLKDNLDHLLPKLRTKRGLINGLGSIIKSITGNMDNDDYQELGRVIAEINKNEDILKDRYNDQISINTKMISRFNEIQKYVNDQTRKIEFEIKSVENNTQNLINILKFDQNFHKIMYNIELLHDHLSDIIESITLAKLKVISKHILNNNELHYIHDHLNRSGIQMSSEEGIYELLWLQAYYNNSQIIFSVQIPKFYPKILYHYKIIPLLINNTYSLEVPTPNIILNEHIYQFMTKPCNKVEAIYYCEKQTIKNNQHSCIPQIINNQPATCNMTKAEFHEEINQVLPEYLYVTTENELPMSSTCPQKQKSIKGIQLIHFKDCTIRINSEEYTSTTHITLEDIIILQPYNDINTEAINTPIRLSTLHNWTIKNNEAIQILHTTTQIHAQQRNIVAGLLITLTILVILYISVKKICLDKRLQAFHIRLTKRTESTVTPVAQNHRFCSPLRGEELRPSTTPTTLLVSTTSECAESSES